MSTDQTQLDGLVGDASVAVDNYTVLVTGANSGLGYATCARLLDEFLTIRPTSQSLHLIFTTRSKAKNDDTLIRLRQHLQKTLTSVYGKDAAKRTQQRRRIHLQGETVDLTSLVTVKALAKRLRQRAEHIDVLVLNAGIGGWSGMNWPVAIWSVCTDLKNATTWPTYKKGYKGRVLETQIRAPAPSAEENMLSTGGRSYKQGRSELQEPRMGETFTANVFGHYMLTHWLVPVMRPSSPSHEPGKVIWVSSIEAHAASFDLADLHGLNKDLSYESSKRVTDLLVLTSQMQSTKTSVSAFFDAKVAAEDVAGIRMYLAHPGVCATSIAGLPWILEQAMLAAFYLARWLGSVWHPIWPYLGATASVWLALASAETLDRLDTSQGKGKWGSATDWSGAERITRTEVQGYGWSGNVGEKPDGGMRMGKSRARGATDVTKEERDEFEVLGGKVWREMEALRVVWEKRLAGLEDF